MREQEGWLYESFYMQRSERLQSHDLVCVLEIVITTRRNTRIHEYKVLSILVSVLEIVITTRRNTRIQEYKVSSIFLSCMKRRNTKTQGV
jgi:hypothetical protein